MATRAVQFGTIPAGNAPVEFGNAAAADEIARSVPGDSAPSHEDDATSPDAPDPVIESED